MEALDKNLELYLVRKAPALPAKWQEVLVKFLPWITLVIFLMSLPAVLALFGIGALLTPFAFMGGVGFGMTYTLAMIVLAVDIVIMALALPGLFKRKKSGWKLLYYSALINAVYSILTFSIGGLIIGTLLSLYLLFQIRHHYH